MKAFISSILILAAAVCNSARAQSNPTDTPTDAKKNQRVVSSPTPTPTPARVVGVGKPGVDTSADDGEIIKVTTQLVSVPVRVMDKDGRFIGGLAQGNFKVFEDGTQQEITLFSNEHQPFTVALVLDMSYSTTFKIAEIQSAAVAFIEQLRPQDQVMVVSFDQEVHMLCEPTSDRKEIFRAIKSTKIGTGTSLYEAVDIVMNQRLRSIGGRKAIILFTDGVDTTSRRSNDFRNLSDALELDSLIYTVRYDTFADVQRMKSGSAVLKIPPITVPTPPEARNPFPIMLPTIGTPSSQGTTPEEYQKAREYLDQLVMRTGGRLYEATSLRNLADAYSRIASELREFYSIGYYPKQDRVAGKRTQVKVKTDRPGLVVRARETFIRRTPSK
ncbi:MAG: VWA domain-containing protein [Pyrinomonadaceae bacterium]